MNKLHPDVAHLQPYVCSSKDEENNMNKKTPKETPNNHNNLKL